MFDLLLDPNTWIAFATLTLMEVVLGVDNVIFISVLVSKLPKEQADRARTIGLSLALIFRIALLLVLSWIIALSQPVFSAFGHGFSWRDIILLAGGLFLIYKAVTEMHAEIEEPHEPTLQQQAKAMMSAIVSQIILLDLAREAGLKAFVNHDSADNLSGKFASTWVVVAREVRHLGGLQKRGMEQDVSWTRSAAAYAQLYRNLVKA